MAESELSHPGKRIAQERRNHKMSVADLALLSGVSANAIMNLESGRKKDMPTSHLVGFCRALRVNPAVIVPELASLEGLGMLVLQARSAIYTELIQHLSTKMSEDLID